MSRKRLKIGIVTQFYPPQVLGGSQLSIFYIAKGLSIYGHKVDVFTSKLESKPKEGTWNLKNVDVHRIFDSEYSFGLKDFSKPKEMSQILKKHLEKSGKKFDVLYAYGMDTIPSVISCNKFAGRTAASVNGSWATSPYFHIDYKGKEYLHYNFLQFLLDSFLRIFSKKDVTSGKFKWLKIFFALPLYLVYHSRLNKLKKIDIILPISTKLKIVLEKYGVSPKKLHICHNLFEKVKESDHNFIKKTFGIPKSKKILLFSGRLSKNKGCHTLIEAMTYVVKKHPEVHLLFAGQESEKDEMLKLAKKLNVEKYITFGGPIKMSPKNLNSLYKNAYITIYPSVFFEPLPRTPTESMLAGTPVIATNRGGTGDIVKNKETGLIVKPEDSKDLANAIIIFIKNKKIYSKLSLTSKKMAEKLLVENGIKKYINTFKNG